MNGHADKLDTDTAAELRAENQRLRDALGMAQHYVIRYGCGSECAQVSAALVREALAGDGE